MSRFTTLRGQKWVLSVTVQWHSRWSLCLGRLGYPYKTGVNQIYRFQGLRAGKDGPACYRLYTVYVNYSDLPSTLNRSSVASVRVANWHSKKQITSIVDEDILSACYWRCCCNDVIKQTDARLDGWTLAVDVDTLLRVPQRHHVTPNCH